jgi:hypothetical protein
MKSEVNPSDIEKIYGALAYQKITKSEPLTRKELLNSGFQAWGDYFDDCLEELVDEYEHAVESNGEYYLEEIEQEKHLTRCNAYRNS